MNTQTKIGILITVLILILAGTALTSNRDNLTTLSTDEVSVYRWQAIANYYGTSAALAPAPSDDLTTLSADEVFAYRWQAMANYYGSRAAKIPVTGGDLTTLSAEDVLAYRWLAMARFYADHPNIRASQ